MSNLLNDVLKMSTKNFIIEVIEGAEAKRYFIIRELQPGNTPPSTCLVSDDPEEVAQFFDTVKI